MAISCSGETSAPRASVFSKIICDFTARKASRAVLSFSRIAVLMASLMVFSKLILYFFLKINLHLYLEICFREPAFVPYRFRKGTFAHVAPKCYLDRKSTRLNSSHVKVSY